MAEIVILGAGLTGLSAAYHLEKKGFFDYKIFEKEATVGGLCRSVQQDGFTFDYTGHLLHINDPYFRSFIEEVVGLEHFYSIERRSFVYSCNTYTKYPYQINLYGLPPSVIAECIEGYVHRKTSKQQSHTFYDWVLHNFGSGFGKHFFFPYQRKIFAYPVKKLSDSWTGRFVPSTSLQQMLFGALQNNTTENIGYNAQFFYPKHGGIFFWLDKIHKQLHQPVYTQRQVIKINAQEKIIIFNDGSHESYKQLITTLPLDTLLAMLVTPSNYSFNKALPNLLCNKVVNFNLGINRSDLTDKHWIYYPEKEFPFYRLGFTHNFSQNAVPPGCSSLYGEFSYLKASPQTIQKKLQASLMLTKKLLDLEDHEIITEKIIHINHAYVTYNAWRDKNVPILLKELKKLHIYSVGRYGAWKYSSMQEGLLDGKKIADTLLIIPAQQSPEHNQYQPTISVQKEVSS